MYQTALFPEPTQRLLPPRSIWKLYRRGIVLGTSGYSYEDWVGPFYPEGTSKPAMLNYYQAFFPSVEINYTYYSLPQPSTLFQIRNKAPNTLFSVKAHQSITHSRRIVLEEWRQFADAMAVLSDTNQLTSILFQFPYSFKCNHESYLYLDEICHYFDAFRLVFEFRHAGWYHDTTYDYVQQRKITLCSVDAPQLPGLTNSVVKGSSHLAYYRLHGRNAQNWFDGDNVTRYDYNYTEQEIQEIAEQILALASFSDSVYVFANNHPRAQAIETLIALAHTLDHPVALAKLR